MFLVFLLLFSSSVASPGQSSGATDVQVVAAYLYNFGKFVTFPANRGASSDSFQICIFGKDPFGDVLDATVQGESINGRKITARRIPNMQQAQACSILFISTSEENRLPAILAAAQQWRILTVSEIKHFSERGGIIELLRQQDRIRFEVNLTAAQDSHLLLSSELLKVATRVLRKEAKGS
ncbi:MAG: YfiR family protein [Acidobacteria bacterium]|nr:YfiR family protein [Acidobacteriota bacterium]